MVWEQRTLELAARSRGFHLVTHNVAKILDSMPEVRCGIVHLLLLHTSASLTLNENADPDVRLDLEQFMTCAVDEIGVKFRHTCEGPDDMPAHIKSSLLGTQLSLPVSYGKLSLGTWQGIYLGEHRDHAGPRSIVITLSGA